MGKSEWRSTESDPPPVEKNVLFWWRPINDNKYAENCVIGSLSYYEEGKWWNGQRGEYQDAWHVPYWQPLPVPPEPTDGLSETSRAHLDHIRYEDQARAHEKAVEEMIEKARKTGPTRPSEDSQRRTDGTKPAG